MAYRKIKFPAKTDEFLAAKPSLLVNVIYGYASSHFRLFAQKSVNFEFRNYLAVGHNNAPIVQWTTAPIVLQLVRGK